MSRSTIGRSAKRRLKEQATPAERKLICALDDAREPYSFQYIVPTNEAPTGYYIVDFYLPRRQLLVELDGKRHVGEVAHWKDRLRSEAIRRARPNCKVARFWNVDVVRDPAALVRFLQSF